MARAAKKPAEKTARDIAPLIDRLTVNQRTVLNMMALNFSNREIAATMKITLKGVEWYHTQIFKKLELPYGGCLRKRNALAIEAYKLSRGLRIVTEIGELSDCADFRLVPHESDRYLESVNELTAQGYRLVKVVEVFVRP